MVSTTRLQIDEGDAIIMQEAMNQKPESGRFLTEGGERVFGEPVAKPALAVFLLRSSSFNGVFHGRYRRI
jgi:hypothetical protein